MHFSDLQKVEKCSECPYTTRHNCDIRTHTQMHEGKREFACGQCTYSTKRPHVLEAHMQLHMAENGSTDSVSDAVILMFFVLILHYQPFNIKCISNRG